MVKCGPILKNIILANNLKIICMNIFYLTIIYLKLCVAAHITGCAVDIYCEIM